MSISERIVAGGVCPSEINHHNAERLMSWVKDTDSHHSADGCRRKDCVHAPGAMTVDWAAAITSEAAHICTCGDHGNNDPVSASAIIGGFRASWA